MGICEVSLSRTAGNRSTLEGIHESRYRLRSTEAELPIANDD
jgi:hypothetical protein